MDEAKFRRLRQIILDSTRFVSCGVSFDTEKARENGHAEAEITDAEYLLTESSFFTQEFMNEIKQIANDKEDKFDIFFIEFAKIIYVLYKDSKKSMHFFEEDLQKMISLKQYLGFCNEFLLKKPVA